MDTVYIVSHDQHHEHIELRYSIRSLVKHLRGLDRIFIVGYCPIFLKGVIHIPAEDPHKHNLARNIYEKILLACNDDRVSEDFFCINDDHFLNRRYTIDLFPKHSDIVYPTLQDLNARVTPKNYYKPYVEVTLAGLKEKGLPIVNYNVHTPIVYNKHLFKSVMSKYDWTGRKGYIAKSLYFNSIEPFINWPHKDCKIKTPKTASALDEIIGKAEIFSTNEASMNDALKEKLEQMFPEKSKWEIDNIFTN